MKVPLEERKSQSASLLRHVAASRFASAWAVILAMTVLLICTTRARCSPSPTEPMVSQNHFSAIALSALAGELLPNAETQPERLRNAMPSEGVPSSLSRPWSRDNASLGIAESWISIDTWKVVATVARLWASLAS